MSSAIQLHLHLQIVLWFFSFSIDRLSIHIMCTTETQLFWFSLLFFMSLAWDDDDDWGQLQPRLHSGLYEGSHSVCFSDQSFCSNLDWCLGFSCSCKGFWNLCFAFFPSAAATRIHTHNVCIGVRFEVEDSLESVWSFKWRSTQQISLCFAFKISMPRGAFQCLVPDWSKGLCNSTPIEDVCSSPVLHVPVCAMRCLLSTSFGIKSDIASLCVSRFHTRY